MFPLDLPGPQFLIFYGLFAVVVIAALHFARRRHESLPLPRIDPQDPYLFACLRGGPREVACIATLALIDRGLLQISGRMVRRGPNAQTDLARRQIEKEVLRHFANESELFSIMTQPRALTAAAAEYEAELRRHQLVPDEELRNARHRFLLTAAACLVGLGGAKLIVALSAGRSNVLLLIGMMIIAVIAAWKIGNPYRTAIGDSYLASIRSMFSNLRGRASSILPGSGSRELLWLTSLFGVAALPSSAFPFVSGSSCGSSCGGGGGGCGGGGGGGCGGCGS